MSTLPACGGGGLLDLEKAFDGGAISQKEYDRLRKQILED
jgi:hypothetical protein